MTAIMLKIVEGWTAPLQFQLFIGGATANLANQTLSCQIRSASGAAVSGYGTVEVTDAASGRVDLSPGAGLVAGTYKMRLRATDQNGKVAFYPSAGDPITITVEV